MQYEGTPPDPMRFIGTMKKHAPAMEAAGGAVLAVARLKDDPSRFLVLERWESDDAMHVASDEQGDEFNREAGTEGLEWVPRVWTVVHGRST